VAVLTKEKLSGYGPFVDFIEHNADGEAIAFLSLADTLLDVYCSVTNSYLPFDPHLGGKLEGHKLSLLAREFFLWSAHIAQCRMDAPDISSLLGLYLPAQQVEHSEYQAAVDVLRNDLVDTAAFLGCKLVAIAAAKGKLVIDGI
jgi:hypothetical protein